ncbi:MAG: DoxX family protein [Waddliaceae bacterium]
MDFLRAFYGKIISTGNSMQSFLLLLMRLYWGYSFFQAGWGKINQMQPVITYFGSSGIPFPEYMAPFVAWVECIGGLCLLFGFASRLVAIPLAINMIVAMFTAHQKETFAVINAAFGMINHFPKFMDKMPAFIKLLPFNYLLTSLVVLCFGPGGISVDFIFKKIFSEKRGR